MDKQLKKLIDQANKRIERLQKAGIENQVTSGLLNVLEPRGLITKKGRISKRIKSIDISLVESTVKWFLKNPLSTVKGAKLEIKTSKENFNALLKGVNAEVQRAAYLRIGDVNFRKLLVDYTYEESKAAINDLENAQIAITDENVRRVLREQTLFNIIEDELKIQGALDEFMLNKYPLSLSADVYIKDAERNGITHAVRMWYADIQRLEAITDDIPDDYLL